jgi:hypothetical protein
MITEEAKALTVDKIMKIIEREAPEATISDMLAIMNGTFELLKTKAEQLLNDAN